MSVSEEVSPLIESQKAGMIGRRSSMRASLCIKVLVAIFGISFLLLLVFSGIEIAREWSALVAVDKSEARATVQANVDSLALAVWNIDDHAIDVTARSLVNGSSIYKVVVADDFGNRKEFAAPNSPDVADNEWEQPLYRPNGTDVIGTLRVWESYNHVRALLKDRILSLIVYELSKIALLSLLLFLVFHLTITKPLWKLTRDLQKNAKAGRLEPITLPRPLHYSYDEIDAVVDAINQANRERLLAEEEKETRRQYEAQSSKLEALGRLAGGVAHDFNNLLMIMVGYTEFLRQDLPPNSVQFDYVERLARCNERARNLVQQILAFSRNKTASNTPLAVDAVIADLKPILRSAIATTTDLYFDIAAGLPNVLSNSDQLGQVILNLTINAHDALEGRHGRVWIRALPPTRPDRDTDRRPSVVVLVSDPARSYVTIEVEDDGAGISTEVMNRIFEPFYTTKEMGKGTGLGLSIVYNMVKLNDGGLTIHSAPGMGTKVSVQIPVTDENAAKGQAPAASVVAAIATAPRRILVVDDDELVGETVGVGLKRHGCSVAVLANPYMALERFHSDPKAFDVVITDQQMPGMLGVDLIHQIKMLNKDVRCILLTGFSEKLNAPGAPTPIADKLMNKPVEIGQLIEAIDGMLAH